MDETDDDIGDLHTSVIDVVLDLDAITGGLQDSHKRISERSVAHVTDVRSLLWIDARVLDHFLRTLIVWLPRSSKSWQSNETEQFRAIEEDVDVSGAGDLNPCQFLDVFKPHFA